MVSHYASISSVYLLARKSRVKNIIILWTFTVSVQIAIGTFNAHTFVIFPRTVDVFIYFPCFEADLYAANFTIHFQRMFWQNPLSRSHMMLVQRLHPHSIVPTRGSAGAAGLDLHAVDEQVYIPIGGSRLVSTGIAVAIPFGFYGRLASRSGLAVRSGIEVGAGVIDSDYRGEIKVLLRNLDPVSAYKVFRGDRIAQLIVTSIGMDDFTVVTELPASARDAGGFGSTGV